MDFLGLGLKKGRHRLSGSFSKTSPKISLSISPILSRMSRGSSSRPDSMNIFNHGAFKLLVLGSAGVGKTTICRRYVGYDFHETCQPENEVFDTSIFIGMPGENITRQYDLEIYDTNDHVSKANFQDYTNNLVSADGFILVYSKDSKASFMKLAEIICDIRHFKSSTVPIIMLGNKSDLGRIKYEVKENDLSILPFDHFNVSASKNEFIQEAFNSIVQKCAKQKDEENSHKEK